MSKRAALLTQPITAIAGAQWGDEGKGKVVDALASGADLVVRFQGGANAGHTIESEQGRCVVHCLPAGVLHPHTTNVLGPGVALDALRLAGELSELVERFGVRPRLLVSDRAKLVLSVHVRLDALREHELGDRAFGSTRRGIAPFYATEAMKVGIPVGLAGDRGALQQALSLFRDEVAPSLSGRFCQPVPSLEELTLEAEAAYRTVAPYLGDTASVLRDAVSSGRQLLLEGQLGALRDPDWGIYPFCTSTSTLAGFACVGAGVSPTASWRVIAVAKAYSSCIGAGPFVCEASGADHEFLHRKGHEFGATTGRPRRVGWLDLVALEHGVRVQGATEICLTMLDVLSGRERIPVCHAYQLDGRETSRFPLTHELARARPSFTELEGWNEDLSACQSFDDLPEAARRYVQMVEQACELPVRLVGVGPARHQLIDRGAC